MDISGRRTREPTVRSLAMEELLNSPRTEATVGARQSLADRMRLEQILSERNLPSPPHDITSSYAPPSRTRYTAPPHHYESAVAGGSRVGRGSASGGRSKKIRLDTEGRERGRRKVSNRENFVDTGLREPVSLMSMDDDVYDYESASENSVHYLNEGEPEPLHRKPSAAHSGGGYNQLRYGASSQRTVHTTLPTVPRHGTEANLAVPSLGLQDISFNSRDSRTLGSEGDSYSPPPSSRSEKMQRTLKSICLNEREPFPSVRARIAKQQEKEKCMKSRSHDRQDKVNSRSRSPPHLRNSNNNALSDTDTEHTASLAKQSHTEEDKVHLNSSPESVVVRPVKRKVATAPEIQSIAGSSRGHRKVTSGSAAAKRDNVPAMVPRSKSAEIAKTRSSSAVKWVEKTPAGKSRSVSLSTERAAQEKKKSEQIRPDSWRKGMAVVKRELRQKEGGVSVTRPASSSSGSRPGSGRSDGSSRHSGGDTARQKQAPQTDAEISDRDEMEAEPVRDKPIRSKKRVKVKIAEAEPVEPVSKQRNYDAQSVQEFMAKKRKEKRLQDLEIKKKQQQAEKERKDKLKALQEKSRSAASSRSYKQATVRPSHGHATAKASNTTYTTASVPGRPLNGTGVWAPPAVTGSMSYTVTQPTMVPETASDDEEDADVSQGSRHNLSMGSDGEGDTTLTEAELRPQSTTPKKSSNSRSGSRGSTPRSKSDSPLSARNKAVEDEIQQLVQEARLRNQAARQAQAQQTPIKLIGQALASSTSVPAESTDTSEGRVRSPAFNQQHVVKSSRIANLALTTAQLMSKMDMIKADLEHSVLSRSNSRPASSTHWLNMSRSPRAESAPILTRNQRLTSSHLFSHQLPADQLPGNNRAWMTESTTSVSDDDQEDHTHSTVTESDTHSTVTTDSEISENESELSSLDLRIREALARPSNFTVSHRSQANRPEQQHDIIKPVAKVARSLNYDGPKQGDGHSVINTYLRKLKAEREALTVRQPPVTTTSYLSTTSVSTVTTQTLSNRLSAAIQTDTTETTHHAPATQTTHHVPVAQTTHTAYMSATAANDYRAPVPDVSLRPPTTSTQSHVTSQSTSHVTSVPVTASQSAAAYVPASHQVPSAGGHVTLTSQSDHRFTNGRPPGRTMPPPTYSARAQAPLPSQAPRISPAGLDLAMSAGLSLLEGMNQQQTQLSDVERTRFSTLAQQETVALAQILKGNKERQEQQLINLRQKIKQDEMESHQKLAELRRDAEMANQRREEAEAANQKREKAELQDQKEANKISKEATRKLLEAQNESTKAFTEAARMLAERRERLSADPSSDAPPAATQSVVESLRAQSETVTQSLTALVDQQRQQNAEILRMARLSPAGKHKRAIDTDSDQSPDQHLRKHTRSPRPKSRTRSPRTTSTSKSSPRSITPDTEMARTSEDRTSPRQRKHAAARSPKDRQFKDILEKSDMSTTSSRGQSDETIQTDSVVSYSDDFGSPSEKSKSRRDHSKSPRRRDRSKSPATHSTVTESIAESIKHSDSDSSTVKTASDVESTLSPVKDESLIQTDISASGSPVTRSSIPTRVSASISTNMSATDNKSHRSSTDIKSHRSSTATDIKSHRTSGSVKTASGVTGSGDYTSFSTPKTRHSTAETITSGSSSSGESPLHKVVLGAVKEVFKDGPPASDPTFYDKLKSVLYSLKDGGAPPTALSTPSKQGSSPSKPPMVAPLSPRIDRKLTMRRPGGQRSNKRSSFPADSESDESHSLLGEIKQSASAPVAAGEQERKKLKKETASDTDQECQLSALQHQLDEAKRRHAMMKKTRQKYEFHKKQDAYKKQIEYYEEDMLRMKKEMDDLAAMHSHTASTTSATSAALSVAMRPQIKQPRAPSSSGSDNGGRQRHSSGTSDAEQPTPQPSVIQKPLVGKSLTSQLSSARPASYERQRTDSGGAKSVDSTLSDSREKTPDAYGDDFESEISKATPRQLPQVRSPTDKHKPAPLSTSSSPLAGDSERVERRRKSSSASDSIAESIAESIQDELESIQSSKHSESLLSQAEDDLLNLDSMSPAKVGLNMPVTEATPSLMDLKDEVPVFDDKPEVEDDKTKPRSRTDSEASSRTITEAKSDSRTATPTWSRTHSRSRSRSSSRSRSRSRSPTSRTISRTSRSRSRSRSRTQSYTSRSRSRSQSPTRARSRSRSVTKSISDEASIVSEVFSEKVESTTSDTNVRAAEPEEESLLQLDLTDITAAAAPQQKPAEPEVPLMTLVEEKPEEDLLKLDDKPRLVSPERKSPLDILESERSIADEPEPEYLDSYRSDFSSVHSESIKSEKDLSKSEHDQSEQDRSKSEQDCSKSEQDLSKSEQDRSKSPDGSEHSSATIKSEVIEESVASTEKTKTEESDFESDGSLISLGIQSPRREPEATKIDQSPSIAKSADITPVQSPTVKDQPIQSEIKIDEKIDQSPVKERSFSQSESAESVADESIVDDLLESAYQENVTQQQEPLLSLHDELAAALADNDLSLTQESDEELNETAQRQKDEKREVVGEIEKDGQLAQSTPRISEAGSDMETKSQKDFNELERMISENITGSSEGDNSSSSRLSLGSKSPQFVPEELSSRAALIEGKPSAEKGREDDTTPRSTTSSGSTVEEESELDKVIRSAASAVESFAEDIHLDELNQSQADVGVSIAEETTPRSLLSLESSAGDDLDAGLDDSLPLKSHSDEDKSSTSSEDTRELTPTPRDLPADDESVKTEISKQEEEMTSKQKPAVHDEQALEAVCSDIITDSLTAAMSLWKQKRAELASQATPPSTQQDVTSKQKQEVSPAGEVKEKTEIEDKENQVPSKPKQDEDTPTSPPSSSSSSLLGVLPPLSIPTAKPASASTTTTLSPTPAPSVKSPESSSSEESTSPQRSPTKSLFPSFVEEARHEQWAQLDKEIDSVFGANDGDWFDEDFGLGAESKPGTSGAIPTKEILSRVVVPEPVFVVPHQEPEVKAVADSALDVFWQARRYGESWDSLEPPADYLDTGSMLELEATSNLAFRHFVFDFIRDMLMDIYQNEEEGEAPPGGAASAQLVRGPLNRHYKHRQPPTTLDEVREIIHRHIYPAVTGKLVHPLKSARVMSVSRNKRRDKVDTILTQELKEEELSWLNYNQDEQSVKHALVDDVFKVLLEDSVSAITGAYNKRRKLLKTQQRQTTEL